MKIWTRRRAFIGVVVAVVLALSAAVAITTSGQPAPPALTADEQAMAYYLSPERQQILSKTLNGFGMDLARKLIASDTSNTRAWNTENGVQPAPTNGYGVLHAPRGESWSAVFVKFTNGKPDFTEGILGFTVLTGGHTYTLWGGRTLNAEGGIVEGGPLSWGWTWTTQIVKNGPAELNLTMYIVDAKSGQPDPNQRLDLKRVNRLEGLAETVEQVKFSDRVFGERVNKL